MKRIIATALVIIMLLSMIPVSGISAKVVQDVCSADKENLSLTLVSAPEIRFLSQDTDEQGTRVWASVVNTNGYLDFVQYCDFTKETEGNAFASIFNKDEEKFSIDDISCYIQFAYSFDGENWINEIDSGVEEGYYPISRIDADEDDFDEYCNLPTYLNNARRIYKDTVFNGGNYCEAYGIDDSNKTLINDAMLQGKGIKQDDNEYSGLAIDFDANTIYVKARYMLRQFYVYDETDYKSVTYSAWSEVVSYNNNLAEGTDEAQATAQNCCPDTTKLSAFLPVALEAVSNYSYTSDDTKYYVYNFRVTPGIELMEQLNRFDALPQEMRSEITGEYYTPDTVIEMQTGDSDWLYYSVIDETDQFFKIDTGYYRDRDFLEKIGYKAGDDLNIRVSIAGKYSYYCEYHGEDLHFVKNSESVYLRSANSNTVTINTSGTYNINYYLDGGDFEEGTTQADKFDVESTVVYNLDTADYTPTKDNYTFAGWYSDDAFTMPITSIDTKVKQSYNIYAKWNENAHYNIGYDMGGVSTYVYNPNPDKIYTGKTIEITDVSLEGIDFLGWYTAPTGGNKVASLTYSDLTADVTLYARWDSKTIKITYVGAGKDYTNNVNNPATAIVEMSGSTNVLLSAPVKEGFIFDGWYKDKNFSNALHYNEEAEKWELYESADITLYAKFIKGRYNLTYNLGEVEDAYNPNPDTYTAGDAFDFKDLEQSGYTFGGWYADAGFTTPFKSIKATDTGAKTVFAKWEAKKYKVNYVIKSGDADAAKNFSNANATERTVNEKVELVPLVANNNLYKFLGWYDTLNYDRAPVKAVEEGTAKDVTVYAKLYKYTWGDADYDGKVTVSDARLVLRAAINLDKIEDATLKKWLNADLDKAGAISVADARLVLRMSINLDTVASLKLPEQPE